MAAPTEFKPVIVGFLCNWCCYGGADLAGVSRFQYPPYLRVIRLMCSGRVDLEFVPEGERREDKNLLVAVSRYVQPIGAFRGRVQVGDRTVAVVDVPGVTEDHEARW